MIELVPYNDSYKTSTLRWISEFFGFHQSLLESSPVPKEEDDSHAILTEWRLPSNALFVIVYHNVSVGFIRINYRGPNVAWIEDIFVDPSYRGRGIATSAIASAESIIARIPGYTAVCLDVSPRNEDAIRLYHKLGYLDLSLITLRKDFVASKRDQHIKMLGFDFHY